MAEAGDHIGRYTLVRCIAQGGTFEHWIATREDRGPTAFVIARTRAQLLDDDDIRARMLRAFEARRTIRHARVPELIEIIDRGELAAVYQYVPGVSCREMLRRAQDGLHPRVGARIVERIARTLHQARVPPRWAAYAGVEPDNVLIDPSGAPYLLLSPAIESRASNTGEGMIVGAIHYMSPEAIRGLPLLPQSTVFSLGVVLYELLTGRHPFFEGGQTMLALRRIADVDYVPISDELAIDAGIAAVLGNALQSAPEDRYAHPGELADMLDSVLHPDADERAVLDEALRLCPELHDVAVAADETDPSEPADQNRTHLLAEILADRDAIDPYLVYGDWLQARGEVRGELIILHHRKMIAEAERLIAAHPGLIGASAHWFGKPLQKLAAFGASPFYIGDLSKGPLSAEWHLGFVRSLRAVLGGELDTRQLETLLRSLDSEEAFQFLRHLALGPSLENYFSLDHTYAVLTGCRFELESLFVGDLGARAPMSIHRATANVSSAFPSLKRLAIRGAEIHLGRLLLPQLRELRLYTSGLSAECINHVASSSLFELERLELWLGGAPARSAWPDRLSILFEDRHLPKLRRLALADREAGAVEGTIMMLCASELAARLETLDLSQSALGDRAGQILIQSADRLPRVIDLRFDRRTLSPPIADRLADCYSSQKRRSGPTSSTG